MSSIGFFDSTNVDPAEERGPLPPGDYTAAITGSEVKDTKAGTGKYISFEWTVVDGEHKGRKFWQNVNFLNPSPVAQKIGQGELSAICRACAKPNIKDTAELHNIPVRVRLGHEKNQNGEPRTCVKSVLWKESTKPQLAGLAKAAAGVTDDDLPDFLK